MKSSIKSIYIIFLALLVPIFPTKNSNTSTPKQFLYKVPRIPTKKERDASYIYGPRIKTPNKGNEPIWSGVDNSAENLDGGIPNGFQPPKFSDKERNAKQNSKNANPDSQMNAKNESSSGDFMQNNAVETFDKEAQKQEEDEDEFMKSLNNQIIERKSKQLKQLNPNNPKDIEKILKLAENDPSSGYSMLTNEEIAGMDGFGSPKVKIEPNNLSPEKPLIVDANDANGGTIQQASGSIVLQEELVPPQEKAKIQKELTSMMRKRSSQEAKIMAERKAKARIDNAEYDLFQYTQQIDLPSYENGKKIIYKPTKKQQIAKDKNFPPVPAIKRIYWKFQSTPPNVSQKVYKESNLHLPPVLFQSEVDFEAISLTKTNDQLPALRSILSMVSSVNIQTEKGNTLLMYSVMNRNTDAVILLIQHGANINLTNKYGMTALHLAAYMRDVNSATILLQYGANTDNLDINGMTPLMYAITHKDIPMIDTLLQHGSDVDAYNQHGINAIDIAKEINDNDLTMYLESFSMKGGLQPAESIDIDLEPATSLGTDNKEHKAPLHDKELNALMAKKHAHNEKNAKHHSNANGSLDVQGKLDKGVDFGLQDDSTKINGGAVDIHSISK